MNDQLLLVLDAGTTSTRAIAFSAAGDIVASAVRPITQHYPASGWVEHDAGEILACSRDCLEEVATAVGVDRIAAIGITNQRETVVFWDRSTGDPLARAIVWQDRRTADICAALKAHEPVVQARTGLLLDPYFSATKIRWALDNWPMVGDAARDGRLAVGTVESWLIWHLSGGAAHVTDATNASRTMLMNLATAAWDPELLALFGVPAAALPTIVDCAGDLASTTIAGRSIPITGAAGVWKRGPPKSVPTVKWPAPSLKRGPPKSLPMRVSPEPSTLRAPPKSLPTLTRPAPSRNRPSRSAELSVMAALRPEPTRCPLAPRPGRVRTEARALLEAAAPATPPVIVSR
jgi:hypothetical protein